MAYLAMIFACAAALLGAGRADAAAAPDTAQLRRIYDEMTQAVADRDADRLMGFIAADAEFTDVHSHRTTAEQYRVDMKRLFARTRNNRITFTLKNIRSHDGIVDVSVQQVYRVQYQNTNGQWVPTVVYVQGTAQWHKIAGTWKLTRSRELSHRQTVAPEYQAGRARNSESAFGIAHCYGGSYITDCNP